MLERSAQIAAAKATETEARRLANDFVKRRTEAPARPTAPEVTKGPQDARERRAGPASDSKPASTERALHGHGAASAGASVGVLGLLSGIP